jgi:hypothetical protein
MTVVRETGYRDPPRVRAPSHDVGRVVVRRPGRYRAGTGVALLAILGLGAALRLTNIGTLGYNSDEAVYAGQAASLAGNTLYTPHFPVFRAHPLLIQSLLSVVFRSGEHDTAGRLVIVAFGLATIAVVFLLGRELYDRRVGLAAALLLAVMPYHVVVTRQVLLDGPMVFFATTTLLFVARYARTHHVLWFVAAGATLGLSMLAKETSIVLAGGVYAFLALTPGLRAPVRGTLVAVGALVGVFATHPLSMAASGHKETGKAYLIWQLLRRANHGWGFYVQTVPLAVGLLVILAGAAGLWFCRRNGSWREVLLLSWMVVPLAFFQLWPVKGFQYLLPLAPPLTVLAARGLVELPVPAALLNRTIVARVVAVVVVATTLAVPSWSRVQATESATFLAGSGGLPGGREVGRWIADNTPQGGLFLTLGPSMANVVRFYGHREAYGLSVSSNPLRRNPSYLPLVNPDKVLRKGDLQYAVWDAYSAARSPFFDERLRRLVDRYHGRAIYTQTVRSTSPGGQPGETPVVVVYEVRP